MPEAILNVQGMTCSACTASVSEALEKLPEVLQASVSLLTNEAKVIFTSHMDPKLLVNAVEDCGFDAKLLSSNSEHSDLHSTTTLSVVGMTCSACSSSITEALEQVDGVKSCSISLLTNEAKIVHGTHVLPQSLIATVEDCGFDATVISSSSYTSSASPSNHSIFQVTGMTCGACSASIIQRLESMPGVISADVSQITNEAIVTHTNEVDAMLIKEAIEDCGFDASVLPPRPIANSKSEESYEDITLQIYGLHEGTESSVYHYNVEAFLNSLPGVSSFQFRLRSSTDGEQNALNQNENNIESLIDVLQVRLATDLTGVRSLVDGLNSIDQNYSYTIFNSIDQSLSAQLKILSKANDIRQWRSTFFTALALGIPTIALNAMQGLEFWKKFIIIDGLFLVTILQFALASFVLFVLGGSFFKRFKYFLLNKGHGANMDVLVCISCTITYTFSLISISLSVWYGDNSKPPKVLFDTIVMLVCFVSFGKWIENKAKGATSFALSHLLSITPTTCLIVLFDDTFDITEPEKISYFPTRDVSIDLIQKDDIVVVIPGAKMPVDGVIIHGSTEIDESVVTGESLPVHKEPGSRVIGGSINGPSIVFVKVTGAGKNSQLHQIINIVKDSQVNKAPVQRFADYIAARFVFFILILSLLTLTFWIVCARYYPENLPNTFHKEVNGKYFVCFKLAISVIVVACPCALGLAAPTAVMVGTGVGASHGALIKGGDVLERANDVNVILFDKTGTLTSGEMEIIKVHPICNEILTENSWWNLVGSLEANSEHPTAKAIVRSARTKIGLTFEDDTFKSSLSDLKIIPGMGLSANVSTEGETHSVAVGNLKLVVKDYPKARSTLAGILEGGFDDSLGSICHVVIDGNYCGYMILADAIKPCAKDVVHYLQHEGQYQVGIITGDTVKVARKVGEALGIPKGNIFGDVLPVEKDKIIENIRNRFGGRKNISIAFVGDGINDAPALVNADLGMAISSGTDIAVDSAEIVLLGSDGSNNDLYGIITALEVSRATFSKIKWNFFCACIYNVFMLPFAMGCFLPFNVMLSPAAAAGAMACSSISVVLNSLMLKNWSPPDVHLKDNLSLEESKILNFSLSESYIDDFNYVKRRNIPKRLRWFKWKRNLGLRSSFQRKENQEYEPLHSN